MNSTTISAGAALRSARTGTHSTTAFDQDNRRSGDVHYRPTTKWHRPKWGNLNSYQHARTGDSQYSGPLVIGETSVWIGDGEPAVKPTDPNILFFAEFELLSDHLRNIFFAYRDRIEELRKDAEDEEIVINDTSEQDFWEFMRTVPCASEAELVVTERGNLRASWRGDGEFMGLQFLGERRVEYVAWTRRSGSMKISPKAGRDTLEGVKEQVLESKLTSFPRSRR